MAGSIPRLSGDISLQMIDDFLNPMSGKPLSKFQILTPSATSGIGLIEESKSDDDDEYYVPFSKRADSELNTSYAIAYKNEINELNRIDDSRSICNDTIVGSGMSQVESVTTFDASSSIMRGIKNKFRTKNLISTNLTDIKELSDSISSLNIKNYEEQDLHVYKTYKFNEIHKYDKRLKISSHRESIVNLIDTYPVCIIQGGTGCGKTTQVPQYLLDHHAKKNEYCNIIVTQPRRIAAISVASRVSNERGWNLGSVCGYQIGLDRKYMSQDTRIAYVTTGVLLQKLINRDDINRYTHVIIDEVHERDLDVDFTLLVLKLMIQSNANIKVILMSATIDCLKFSKYFSNSNSKIIRDAPVYYIDGATYQVKEYYLDDLFDIEYKNEKLPDFKFEEPKMFDEAVNMVIELLKNFDEEEKKQIINNPSSNNRIISDFPELRGSVLIFVPGMRQIQQLEDLIRKKLPNSNLYILPLHSDIVIDQQKRVFEPQQATRRKVIISTSIAESSITVPDIKYVIDFCLTKELWCDPYTNYTHLRMEWASLSSLNQRKGRAGRVSDGVCYRLISHKFTNQLDEQTIPQILRSPLSKLILNVKRLKVKNKDPKRLLAFAIQPPNLEDIDRTILLLKEAGALTLQPNAQDGDLTYAGIIMACLPIDIKLGKLILLGHTFGKLRECIIIAAALSTKTFFVRYFKSHLEAFSSKWFWSQGSFCDCLTILNAYNLWEDYQAKGKFARIEDMERWAKSNMIDLYRIREVRELKIEIERRLAEQNIICNEKINQNRRFYEREAFRNGDDYDIDDETDVERHNLIIKIIIAGAFYPNYFESSINDEYEASKMISGKDCRQTVMIRGLPMKQGILYHHALIDIFKICSKLIQIHYEDSKAYIEFKSNSDQVKTNIHFGVYMAVQMRLLRIPIEIKRLNENYASILMNNLNHSRRNERDNLMQTRGKDDDNIIYKYAFSYSCDDDEEEDDEFNDDIYKSKTSIITNTRQLNSYLISSTIDKKSENLSNPEILIKNLREFSIIITEVIECGYFWAQINETSYKKILSDIQLECNFKHPMSSVRHCNIQPGIVLLSQYTDELNDTYLYRAKVLDIDVENQKAKVLFVDYGNKEEKKFNQLFNISNEMLTHPFQAIKFKLANTRLNKLKCPNGVWTKAANDYFIKLVSDRNLVAYVYSIVDNVVRIELKDKDTGIIINQELIKSGYAVTDEESQISRKYSKNTDYNNNNNNSSLVSLDMIRDNDICLNEKRKNHIDDESKYDGTLKLVGPYSPLEVKYYPIVNIGKSKSAKVERDSINYATLDDDPQNQFERLMIASDVSLNPSANTLILRGTTLMPKIRGLTNILCLLFSPTCEVRLSHKKTSYTGALCGLGCDKVTRIPLFIDNDIECTFDVKIGFEEFKMINAVRMAMNMIIGSEEEAKKWTSDARLLRNLQQKACNRLLALIEKERTPTEKKYFYKYGKWNQLKENEIVNVDEEFRFENYLYSCHSVAVLEDNMDLNG